ncbi:tetratricopeptide repeat protein [Actinomadura sp. DC4]|uniref:tetratricopeptide repeat protein n=1 Tax=Actinomadura sp. DC4 TaxID=3055069 RepID=UPI0025B250B9|nr:tetratricopeptide repeat protein [Actinomadura sp. DC4]MDN3357883.1 tetratricopeptide repeat protein [Actinomadura sp. DC4]
MSGTEASTELAIAQVLGHCGENPAEAVRYIGRAITMAPHLARPYDMLADLCRDSPAETAAAGEAATYAGDIAALAFLRFIEGRYDDAVLCVGTVTGHKPQVAWADAPWFGEPAFLASVGADAVAEAALRTMDGGHDLTAEGVGERFQPWFRLIEVVADRDPRPEVLARMAMFLRACGRTDESFALCDRADEVEPAMLTEVVRAGTWRVLGDQERTLAAFERALALEPANWSLYLDLADTRVAQGDYAAAVDLVDRGLRQEPQEVTLRAARAAFRARHAGSAADLTELIALAPSLPDPGYRNWLLDQACDGSGLPADLVTTARALKNR